MKRILLLALLASPLLAQESFHRAEQDREIRYWLLEPSTHQFHFTHDLTISEPGKKTAESFLRKGSTAAPDVKMTDLDSGKPLPAHFDEKRQALVGNLDHPIEPGRSARVRVEETYTDPAGYTLENGELVWKRTLGRPLNFVTLPPGWMLTSVNTPATITLDSEGRIQMRFVNTRNDELSIVIRARKRTATVSPQAEEGVKTLLVPRSGG